MLPFKLSERELKQESITRKCAKTNVRITIRFSKPHAWSTECRLCYVCMCRHVLGKRMVDVTCSCCWGRFVPGCDIQTKQLPRFVSFCRTAESARQAISECFRRSGGLELRE